MIIVVEDEALAAKDYTPTLFRVSWEDHDYRSVGSSDITVTFTGTDPARGSYADTLTCNPGKVTPDSMFDVTLSGECGEI